MISILIKKNILFVLSLHELTLMEYLRFRIKYLQVHSIHPKRPMYQDEIFHTMTDITVCVTIINENGEIDTKLKRIYMDGKDFGWATDMIGQNSS